MCKERARRLLFGMLPGPFAPVVEQLNSFALLDNILPGTKPKEICGFLGRVHCYVIAPEKVKFASNSCQNFLCN